MQTPDNWAGSTTEQIMSRIRSTMKGRGLDELGVRTYNAVYECVYEVLFRESSWPEIREQLKKLHRAKSPG